MEKMTEGNVTKILIKFTIPLILGNIFQLTYNAVDSIIVGRFSGENALAAIGTADPIMNLLILGIMGLCIGASVLMSNFFGAGDYKRLKMQIGTTITLCTGIVLLVMTAGLILSDKALRVMQTPEDIMPLATVYLHIIFIGMPFTCYYNILAAALRSVGDSRTPVRFLALSCVLNGGLDLLMVGGLRLGAAGAGFATVISEAVSAILCMIYIYRHVPILHLTLSDLKINRELAKKTVSYGGITALQQCSQPIGKLLIQGVINTLGVSAMAAFNAVGKIEDFALVPGRSISNALMTYTAQNMGAEKKERAKQGLAKGILLEALYGVLIGLFILLLHGPLLNLFGDSNSMMEEGGKYFQILAFFYWMPALTNCMQGFFRGIGNMRMTLYGTLIQISFRVLFTFFLVPNVGIKGVAIASVFGWAAMFCLQIPYSIYVAKKKLRHD